MRHTMRGWVTGAALWVGSGGGLAVAQAPEAQPAAAPGAVRPQVADTDPTAPVAFIYGNVPVTRQDLGEFLMARGGANRLELLVNRVIIETECKEKGITVTDTEMMAAFNADLDGMSIDKAQFVDSFLKERGLTLYEWMEDTIRPKLLLTKLIHDQVQVSDAEVQVEFEKEFGEKRVLQTIIWPASDDFKSISQTWDKIRQDTNEFDRVARTQGNPHMAAAGGMTRPISLHTHGKDDIITRRAFSMKEGEVSEVMNKSVGPDGKPGTGLGYVVIKLVKVIPADETVDREKMLPMCRQRAFEEKVTQAMPVKFQELREKANPNVLYRGPGQWRDAASVVKPVGGPATIGQVISPAQATEPAKRP